MLNLFIFLILLPGIVLTSGNAILESSVHPQKQWIEETTFWGGVSCRAGRKRTFNLHETPRSRSSRYPRDFFGALVSYVQAECRSTTSANFYLEDDVTDYKNGSSESMYEEVESAKNNEEIEVEPVNGESAGRGDTRLFPNKDVEIILMMVENVVQRVVDGNIFDDNSNRRGFLILTISDPEDPHRSSELLKNTFAVLLRRLWLERRVLNVFFAAPFSSLGYRIWFYDPFIENVTSGLRGRIFGVGLETIPTIDRLKDLKGYTLNVGMFEAAPAAIKFDSGSLQTFPFTRKSQIFGGVDGITMMIVAKQMNFSLNIVPPTDGLEFGYVCLNGTFVGTIGDVAYHRIDIGFNSMYTKIYSTRHWPTNMIEFTSPIDFDRLCVIVPRAKKIPRWLRTFYYFDPAIWGCILLTQLLISFVWYLLRVCSVSLRGSTANKDAVSYHVLLLDTFLLFVGAPLNRLNTSQAERVLLSALLLLGLTVIGMFTGTLYQSFTQERHYKEMDTLKEVDDSGIGIGTGSPNLRDVFGIEENENEATEVKSLRQKFQVFADDTPTIEKTAYRKTVAALARQHAFLVQKYTYVDETGTSLLHQVDECPRSYYLSYVVPKDSAYIERLNVLIRRLQEAGLPTLWNSVTTNKLVFEETSKTNFRKDRSTHVSFNLNDMQMTFYVLFIGHLAAIFVLIGEIISDRTRKRLGSTLRCAVVKNMWVGKIIYS